jgi:hypothetical protein
MDRGLQRSPQDRTGRSRDPDGTHRRLGRREFARSGIAAEAIGNIGPEAKAAVPKLRGLLPKTDNPENVQDDVVTAVVTALGQIGDDAVDEGDVEILRRRAGNEVDLMQILASLGPAANEATPIVAEGLESPHVRVRSAACLTLARIAGSDARVGKSVIARLSAASGDSFAEVRAASADAIGLVAPQDGNDRAAIERLRLDRFATVRHAAKRAIQTMNKHRLLPDRIWTNYFDPFGPATGASLATEMAAGDSE